MSQLPAILANAYNWTDAAGELDELRGLTGEALATYCAESAANARTHGETVTELELESLAEWLRAQS